MIQLYDDRHIFPDPFSQPVCGFTLASQKSVVTTTGATAARALTLGAIAATTLGTAVEPPDGGSSYNRLTTWD